MALDAAIPLQVQTPTPQSPIATVGQLMNIRDMASQVQMRQAQTQHFQAQAAQMQAEAAQNQRLLAGRNKLDALMTSDPKIAEAVGKGDWGAVQGQGIPFEVLNAAQEGHAKVVSQLATTDTATLNNKLTRNKILGNGLESMTDPSTPESDIPGLANSWIQQSASNGLFKDIDQSLVPKEGTINTRADVNKAAATLGLFHGMTQAALELQESRAKADEATSKAKIAARQAAGQTPAGLLPPEIAPAAKAQADAAALVQQQDATKYASALGQGSVAAQAFLGSIPAERAAVFHGVTDPEQALRLGMTPEQITEATNKKAELAKQTQALQYQMQHGNATLGQGSERLGLEKGRLDVERANAGLLPNTPGTPTRFLPGQPVKLKDGTWGKFLRYDPKGNPVIDDGK